MPIDVHCVCGKRLRVKDEMAGKRGRCPACQAKIEIPSAHVEELVAAEVVPIEELVAPEIVPTPPPARAFSRPASQAPPIPRPALSQLELPHTSGTAMHGLAALDPDPRKRIWVASIVVGALGLMLVMFCVGSVMMSGLDAARNTAERIQRESRLLKTQGGANANVSKGGATASRSSPPSPSVSHPGAPVPPPAIKFVKGMRRKINLLANVDIPRDAVQPEKWKLKQGELLCTEMHFVPRISFPYRPCEEFDIILEFTQPSPRNGVGLIVPNKATGSSYVWLVGINEGKQIAVSVKGNNEKVVEDPAGMIIANKRYVVQIRVRRHGIETKINGRSVANYPTNFRDLSHNDWYKMPSPDRIAVSCDDVTTFHRIDLTEITGEGELGK